MFLLMWQFYFHVSDAGTGMLILFFHHFLQLLAGFSGSTILANLSVNCPKTLTTAQNLLEMRNHNNFLQYVVCPKCSSIYEYTWCINNLADGTVTSKSCIHISFPNHPHRNRRKECGANLLKTVRKSSGKIELKPIKVYCYHPLKASLSILFSRTGFFSLTERWRNRDISTEMMGDIYDGKVWQEFMQVNGRAFLTNPFNLLLSLNVDWFQPFSHVTDSVGVVSEEDGTSICLRAYYVNKVCVVCN